MAGKLQTQDWFEDDLELTRFGGRSALRPRQNSQWNLNGSSQRRCDCVDKNGSSRKPEPSTIQPEF
jgi:hypothetical protein